MFTTVNSRGLAHDDREPVRLALIDGDVDVDVGVVLLLAHLDQRLPSRRRQLPAQRLDLGRRVGMSWSKV